MKLSKVDKKGNDRSFMAIIADIYLSQPLEDPRKPISDRYFVGAIMKLQSDYQESILAISHALTGADQSPCIINRGIAQIV